MEKFETKMTRLEIGTKSFKIANILYFRVKGVGREFTVGDQRKKQGRKIPPLSPLYFISTMYDKPGRPLPPCCRRPYLR